jgi:hypothetical protein
MNSIPDTLSQVNLAVMHQPMTVLAQPSNLQGFVVVLVMTLGFDRTADCTGLWKQRTVSLGIAYGLLGLVAFGV